MSKLTKTHIVSIVCAVIAGASVLGGTILNGTPPQNLQTINGDHNFQIAPGATVSMEQLQKSDSSVGTESVLMGDYVGHVGDRSVVIVPPRGSTNVILNQPMAVGYSACPSPGSVIIGAYAGGGCRSSEPQNSR
jgi:hypothetical protein